MLQLSGWTRALLYACIIVSVLQWSVCALYYRRRDRTPIRERMPLVAIVEYLSFSLHLSLTLLVILYPRYCFAMLTMLNYAGAITLTATVLRYLGLYLTYRLNRAKIFASTSMPVFSVVTHMVPVRSMTFLDRWLLRNKWVQTWRFQLPYFAAVIMLVTVFNIVVGLTPSVRDNDRCARPGGAAGTVVQLWYLFWGLVLAYIVFLMRFSVDAFSIKWELLFHLRFILLQIALWLIPPLNEYDQTEYPVFAFIYVFQVQVRWVVSMILPIRWSYKSYRLKDLSTLTVRQIMDRPNMLDSLHQFLITEFCIENLYFLLFVQRLQKLSRKSVPIMTLPNVPAQGRLSLSGKALPNAPGQGRLSLSNFRHDPFTHEVTVQNMIHEIYDKFCVQSSAFAINISSQQLEQIEQHLDDGDASIFNGAVMEIERLLEHDSLPRFLTGDLGRQWCTKG